MVQGCAEFRRHGEHPLLSHPERKNQAGLEVQEDRPLTAGQEISQVEIGVENSLGRQDSKEPGQVFQGEAALLQGPACRDPLRFHADQHTPPLEAPSTFPPEKKGAGDLDSPL